MAQGGQGWGYHPQLCFRGAGRDLVFEPGSGLQQDRVGSGPGSLKNITESVQEKHALM